MTASLLEARTTRFVLGPQQWPLGLFLAVGTVNYGYKMFAAVALSPLLYQAQLARRVAGTICPITSRVR